MAGRGKGVKPRVVKNFIPGWVALSVEGVRNEIWLESHPKVHGQARCKICKTPDGEKKVIKVAEGYTAITKHARGAKHQENLAQVQQDPNHNLFENLPQQISMEEAFNNATKKTQEEDERKAKLLNAQIKFAAMVAHHNLPSSFNTCFSDTVGELFPDSEIAKLWSSQEQGMRETKGDYFVSHGIAKFQQQELANILKESFFSLNFDESSINKKTELDINVSFVKKDRVVKTNFQVVEMTGSTTAGDIVAAVFEALDKFFIPRNNIVSIATDGCSTMLGSDNGVHAIMRESLPHLPDWGGCMAHSPSNMLKAATPYLGDSFIKAIPAFHTYLSSQSLHRMRSYKEMAHSLGLNPSEVPKMLDVRFRVIVRLADWLVKDDGCVYPFIQDLARRVKNGEVKEPTETEITLLNHYYDNYIECLLSANFISSIGVPIIEFLDYFESQKETRIHTRYQKIVQFVYILADKYLKNGGLGSAKTVTGSQLLQADFKDSTKFVSVKDVWIGEKAELMLKELGLTKESPEVADWLKCVFKFYQELLTKAVKYFKPSLESKALRCCDVLNPLNCLIYDTEKLQKSFIYLARKWPNIISPEKLDDLKTEVALLKTQDLEASKFLKPAVLFHKLKESKQFPLLAKLGLGLLTIYNSSSCAETDFSILNAILADSRKCNTSQKRLEDRMRVKSDIYQCRFECIKCEDENRSEVQDDESEEDIRKKRQRHCHCPLWKPSAELVESMKGGQPSKRYKQELKRKREELEAENILKKVEDETKERMRKQTLKESLLRLKTRIKKKELKSKSQVPIEVNAKEKKRKGKEDREKRIEAKRSRISFLN